MITIKEIVDDYRERWTAASIGFTETKQGEQLPLPPDSVDQSNDGWVDGVSDLAKLIFYIADGSWAEGSAERSDGSPSVLSDEAIALTAYPTDDHGGAVINQ